MQLEKFITMKTSIKGSSLWSLGASNEHPTSHIIRHGVRLENCVTFAKNILAFVVKHNLDGFDSDWKYPDADDIAGSDPGSPEDGENYPNTSS